MPEKHYTILAAAYPGCFSRPWAELKKLWDQSRGLEGVRSYFDNAHDIMRDVWEFSRVTGDERHGHATPKPVEMMERVMKSSLPPGGLCVEPFGGSGATLMGAEKTGRICHVMELQPRRAFTAYDRWGDAPLLLLLAGALLVRAVKH
jgi:DNA modification methylase